MPETGGTSIEVAHHLNETTVHERPHVPSRVHHVLEVIEAIILAMVAITTAWSGYQAARWDSTQSTLYGKSSRLRVEGQALELEANQLKAHNAATVVEWLKSEARGESNLADLFERRLLPECLPAFDAWKKTDPLHNPNAPPGPTLMPSTGTLLRKRGHGRTRRRRNCSSREHALGTGPTSTCESLSFSLRCCC